MFEILLSPLLVLNYYINPFLFLQTYLMKKLWYTETSRDKWGAVFTFKDWESSYAIRLAGNPILMLEFYYNLAWGTDFMKKYILIKNGKRNEIDNSDVLRMNEAKNFCEKFIDVVKAISNSNKSTFVIYKDNK